MDTTLSTKKLIVLDKLTKEAFDWLIEEILSRFK